MLIYCPKCSTGYEIDEDLIKDRSRKVKCSHCNEIFEAGNLIEKSVDNVDSLDDISEENAFEALAAMMRDADVISEEVVVDNNDSVENAVEESLENTSIEEEKIDVKEDVVQKNDTFSDNKNIEENKTVEENNIESKDENKTEGDGEEESIIDINSIYERLSEHTSHLIEREKTLPVYEKIWLKIKEILGFHFRIKWSYIFIGLFVFISLSLFNNRYDIVRKLPFMNGLYKAFGINAKIAGEGLEFQNITWDYFIDEGVRKLEIKGFINNVTSEVIKVPIVHVEILDKNTSLLQSFNREIKEKEISSANRIPLQIIVEHPAPIAKYVYFTFIDKE